MFHHGHAFGRMEGDAVRAALDKFQLDDPAGLVQFRDEAVVVALAGTAVLVRNKVGAGRGVHDEAGGIFQAGHLQRPRRRAREDREEQQE